MSSKVPSPPVTEEALYNAADTPALNRKITRFFTWLAVLPLLFGVVIWTQTGFDRLTHLRVVERTPVQEIGTVVGGVVSVTGEAWSAGETLRGPRSGSQTYYYHYVIERERQTRRGARWRTVSTETAGVPFSLVDRTGQIAVDLAGADIELPISHRRIDDGMRYTEYRIDQGTRLFLLGMASLGEEGRQIRFDAPGYYPPIVSGFAEERSRTDLAFSSVARTWLALLCLSVATLLLCLGYRVHRIVVVLTLLTGGTFLSLAGWGLSAARLDLAIALEQQGDRERLAREAIQAELSAHGIAWDGDWAGLPDVLPDETGPIPDRTTDALGRAAGTGAAGLDVGLIRQMHRHTTFSAERAQRTWQELPERWIAPLLGIAPPQPVALPAADQAVLAALEKGFEPTRLSPWISGLAGTAGVALALLLPVAAFRSILVKRRIEGIPTSRTAGVAYGLSELKGTVDLVPGTTALKAPLSGTPCVMYRYIIRERRGSGRNARWVEIHNSDRRQRFLCRDEDGSMPIDPQGAELIAETRTHRDGKLLYIETMLPVGAPLYALGHAGLDQETGDSLILQAGEGTFLLSDYSEEDLVLRKARIGFSLLTGGFVGALTLALSLAGGVGAFNGLAYLLAALVGPVFFLIVLSVLMYNDLVFLRERVRRTWANIDVALKKRAELLPQLEAVVRQAMAHERQVLDDLATVRSQAERAGALDRDAAEAMLATERRALDRLLALREASPELGAAAPAGRLIDALVALENEVAFMREGYNNAVERFNTRRNHVPEAIFARLFGFRPVEHFRAPVVVRSMAGQARGTGG